MVGPTPDELEQPELRRSAAFLQAPLAAAVVDVDGRLLDANVALRRLLRLPSSSTPPSLLGHLHPNDRGRAVLAFRRLVTARDATRSRELRVIGTDGTEVWTLASAAPTGTGRYVVQFVDITDRREAEQQLAHAAVHDPLTGLPNRVLFIDRLSYAISMQEREPGLLGVFFLDLDGFKAINDTLGHARGDELLVEVSRRLRQGLRTADTLARFGGDEFALLLRHLHSERQTTEIAERVASGIRPPVLLAGRPMAVTASIGIALSLGGSDPKELLRRADVAMYRAKARDGADWVLWQDQP